MQHRHDPTHPFLRVERGRLLKEKIHDAYRLDHKLAQPTVCPRCHAAYEHGRWRWAAPVAGAHKQICPACHRIEDDYPAGTVTLEGDYLAAHASDIEHLVLNEEARAKAEHALERIMKFDRTHATAWVITTTDLHLARRIGEAVHRAHRGDLDFHYNAADPTLRVFWSRD